MELYRAISKDEKDSLEKNGKFIPKEGCYEGKLFAQSLSDAIAFGKSFAIFEEHSFFVVKVEIPDDFAARLYYELFDAHLDVKATAAVDRDLLDDFNNEMNFEVLNEYP